MYKRQSQATIDKAGSFGPHDLMLTTPGLEVTSTIASRENVTYSIRGEGFTYGTLFPAVVTYFNEVPIAKLTQGSFFDLANVQVLRGPQGVQFGRVTDGGNVMMNPQLPKNSFGGYVEAKLGNYSLRSIAGAINIPIIADKVLLRGSFNTERRAGYTINDYNGKDMDNVHSDAYRGVLTLHPIDSLKNITTFQYQQTDNNGTGVIFEGFNSGAAALQFLAPGGALDTYVLPLYGIDAQGDVVYKYTGAPGTSPLIPGAAGLTPMTLANYVTSIENQLAAQQARGPRHVSLTDPQFDRRTNVYLTNVTTLDVTSDIQVKNVFGYVTEKDFSAQMFAPVNGGLTLTCISGCVLPHPSTLPFYNNKQWSDELRIAGKSFDNRLTWAVGAYVDEQSPNGLAENATVSFGVLARGDLKIQTTKSRAFYASGEYAITDAWKITGGIRNTHDILHSDTETLTAPTFANLPFGICETIANVGTCYHNDAAFNATNWTVGTSYKVDNNKLVYAKISTGYRPGGANSTAPEGVSPLYAPEHDTSIEVGIKADWHIGDVFARTNLAAFRDRYKNIQKLNVLVDQNTGLSTSLIQNVAAAVVQGIEFEGTLIPVKGLTLGATAAYTSAKYDEDHANGQTLAEVGTNPTSPCDPTVYNNVGFCTDNRFNGTPEFQWTLSADYATDLGDNVGKFDIGVSLYHQSSVAFNDTSELNPQSIEHSYSLVNLTAGLKNAMGQPLDLGFFVTNLTNKLYRVGTDDLTQNGSLGPLGSIYAAPRMFGFSMKYRFGSDAK